MAKNNPLCKTLLRVMALTTLSGHSDRQAVSLLQPAAGRASDTEQNVSANSVQWTAIKSEIVNAINSDIKADLPTVDVGIYYPSNVENTIA